MKRSRRIVISALAALAIGIQPAFGAEGSHRGGRHHEPRHHGDVIFHGLPAAILYGIFYDLNRHRFHHRGQRGHRHHRRHHHHHRRHHGWTHVPPETFYMAPRRHRHHGHEGRRHHHGDYRWHRHGNGHGGNRRN